MRSWDSPRFFLVSRLGASSPKRLRAEHRNEVWSWDLLYDRSFFCRYQHPTWFASPRRCGDDCLETRNVLTTTIDFLSQTGVLQHCRFVVLSVLFSVHPLADVCRTVLKPHAIRLATP